MPLSSTGARRACLLYIVYYSTPLSVCRAEGCSNKFLVGDIFKLTPGTFDAIWDCNALVALNVETLQYQHVNWSECITKLASLLSILAKELLD